MNLQTGRIYIDLQPIKAVENKICDFTNLDWVGSPRDVFQVLSKSKVIQCNSWAILYLASQVAHCVKSIRSLVEAGYVPSHHT